MVMLISKENVQMHTVKIDVVHMVIHHTVHIINFVGIIEMVDIYLAYIMGVQLQL